MHWLSYKSPHISNIYKKFVDYNDWSKHLQHKTCGKVLEILPHSDFHHLTTLIEWKPHPTAISVIFMNLI